MSNAEQNLPQQAGNVDGAPPQNPPPEGQQSGSSSGMPFHWIAYGLNDWVNLLGKPEPGHIFKHPPDFKWSSLLRLIVLVLSFCGVLLGIALVVFDRNPGNVVFQKWPTVLLICGAVLAVLYTFIAWFFKVSISMRDALFSILLLSLPWISLTVGLYFLVKTLPDSLLPWMGLILLVWIWLVPFLLTRNLCVAIRILAPEVKRWRVNGSVIVWIVLVIGSLVLVQVFVEVPPPVQ